MKVSKREKGKEGDKVTTVLTDPALEKLYSLTHSPIVKFGRNVLRRSNLECKIGLLQAMKISCVPTVVMYQTGISWKSMNTHVMELVDKGLVSVEDAPEKIRGYTKNDKRITRIFLITERGEKLLKMMDDVKTFVEKMEEVKDFMDES